MNVAMMWQLLGGVIGLLLGLCIVYGTQCGDVAAALWGGGMTNLGLLIGGLFVLKRIAK